MDTLVLYQGPRSYFESGGGGGGGADYWLKVGGWKYLFPSNSLKFPKKWGGWSPPPFPSPFAGPVYVRVKATKDVVLQQAALCV